MWGDQNELFMMYHCFTDIPAHTIWTQLRLNPLSQSVFLLCLGERCRCGQWVAPSFHMDRKKVDLTATLPSLAGRKQAASSVTWYGMTTSLIQQTAGRFLSYRVLLLYWHVDSALPSPYWVSVPGKDLKIFNRINKHNAIAVGAEQNHVAVISIPLYSLWPRFNQNCTHVTQFKSVSSH